MEMISEKIIVALDISDDKKLDEVLEAFKGKDVIFKVGLQLFNAKGPDIIDRLKENGNRVFLDLKLFDIPNTITEAAKEMAKRSVDFFTVHLLNGRRSLTFLKDGLEEFCGKEKLDVPEIVGVTVLTSFNEEEFHLISGGTSIKKMVEILAVLGYQAGIRSFVSSPREISLIKGILPDVKLITPGIRPKENLDIKDDQKRVLTPGEAIELGADYLVIGRPIIKSKNMLEAYEKIVKEIEERKEKK